jgi:hypothetical protein
LRTLSLASDSNHALGALPETLEKLSIRNEEYQHPLELPQALKYFLLSVDRPLDMLPPALEELVLWPDDFSHSFTPLPPTLKKLTLRFSRPLKPWPPALEELTIETPYEHGGKYLDPLGPLPDTLQRLILTPAYTHPLEGLPAALTVHRMISS